MYQKRVSMLIGVLAALLRVLQRPRLAGREV
jgi:hypothetical protein